MPLLPGIFQSIKTRSKPPVLNRSMATWPLGAWTVLLRPIASSQRQMIVRIVPESSATSTRAMGCSRLGLDDRLRLARAARETDAHFQEALMNFSHANDFTLDPDRLRLV